MPRTPRTPRAHLVAQLRELMVPFLEAKGFERHPFPQADAPDGRELRALFPFGTMKRRSGANLEIVEIQLDSPGRAKFVLNFGTVPPGGVTLPWGEYPQDEMTVTGLPDGFRLHSRTMFMPWFGLGWRPGPEDEKARRAVERAIALFAEVDAWFERREIGPHVRRIGFTGAVARP